MEGIIIERAGPQEAEWGARLMAASEPWLTLTTTADQFLKTLQDPAYQIFAARLNHVTSGLIVTHPRGLASSPYVKSLVVSPEHRSAGIGAGLMAFAEDYFRDESKHLFLCVSSFNKRAQAFYNRIGYSAVGELKDYIIPGESEIIMHKRLK